MTVSLSCIAIFVVVIYSNFCTNGIPTFVNEDGLIGFDDPDHHNHHYHSGTQPKKRSTPSGGENMDRGLGFSKKKPKRGTKKTTFPWDPTKAQEKIRFEPSDRLKSFIVKEEEPFPESFYDDYDFEFPKGMQLNGNFEGKVRRVTVMRMKRQGADAEVEGNAV